MGNNLCGSRVWRRLSSQEPLPMDATFGVNFRGSAGETRRYPGGSKERMAHPRGGLSSVFACSYADSVFFEPVLQPGMYPQLYPHWLRKGLPNGLRNRLSATSRGMPHSDSQEPAGPSWSSRTTRGTTKYFEPQTGRARATRGRWQLLGNAKDNLGFEGYRYR